MSGPAGLYVDYLTAEGYRPTIDGDGDVMFKDEGLTYYVIIDADDEPFFRLMLPSFWGIENAEERQRALVAANEATMKTKTAKVYVNSTGTNVSASIEMFFGRPDEFKQVFPRAMSALRTSVKFFVDAINR